MGDTGDSPYSRRDVSLLAIAEAISANAEGGDAADGSDYAALKGALESGLDARLLMAWRKSGLSLGELILQTAGDGSASPARLLASDDEALVRYVERAVEHAK